MTLEEIEAKKKRELRQIINESFRKALAARDDTERAIYISEANFLMRELERRSDSWTSIRDFVLEIIVIGLIGWEIFMSYDAERLQKNNFKDEQVVFQNLQTGSAATASTLVAVRDSIEAMNGTLQKQLALFYEVSVNVVFSQADKKLTISNNGRTNITLWGSQFGEIPPELMDEGRSIPPLGGLTIEGKDGYGYMVSHFPKPSAGFVRYDLYFKNERGESFILANRIGIRWDNDTPFILMQTLSVAPGHWRPGKSKRLSLMKTP